MVLHGRAWAGTAEGGILGREERKRSIAAAAIGDGGGGAAVTRADLLGLLE